MTNSFKLYIGGKAGLTSATDYTKYILRASYDKEFCKDYDFDIMLSGVASSDKSALRAATSIDCNVFFILTDGSNNYLLMKGEIEEVNWTSKSSMQIRGRQCKRKSSGANGQMHQLAMPSCASIGEMTMSDFITGTGWFPSAKGIIETTHESPTNFRKK